MTPLLKIASSREEVQVLFCVCVTFNIIIITLLHLYWTLHWTSSSLSEHMKIFSVNTWNYVRNVRTCKEIPCYMDDAACKWLILKKAKIPWSYVKHIWILTCERKCRILFGLCKQAFLNCPPIFHDWLNKTKLVGSCSLLIAMPNLVDFHKRISLHVIPVRIIFLLSILITFIDFLIFPCY